MTHAMTAPVDGARARALLEGDGLPVAQLQDGVLQLLLDGGAPGTPDLLVHVNVSGALLQMTGQRPVTHDADHAPWVLSLITAYQRAHCWPTGYLRWAARGAPRFAVIGEVNVHVGAGASDEQLHTWTTRAFEDLGAFTRRVHHALAEREAPGGDQAPFDLEAWLEV